MGRKAVIEFERGMIYVAGSMDFLGQSVPVQRRDGVESNCVMQRSAARAMSSRKRLLLRILLRLVPGSFRAAKPALMQNSCRAAPT